MALQDNDLQEVSSFPNCELNDDVPNCDELECAFHELLDESRNLCAKNASHYCSKIGHQISRCIVKKKPSKWRWVVKGSTSPTNTNGPKKLWVPKMA